MPFLALLTSPLLRYGMIVLAVLMAFGWYSEHERHVGAQKLLAKQVKLTEQESQRRIEAEQKAQVQAQADIETIERKAKQNASLAARIATLSARHDRDRCLDADSVRRLNALGHPAGR